MRGWAPLLAVLTAAALSGCAGDPAATAPPTTTSPSLVDGGGSTSSGDPSCAFPGQEAGACPCPGHWHATFAIHVRDGEAARRIDFRAPDPRAPSRPYYDFGRAANMTLAVHMHQSGAETGSADLGPAQFHYEQDRRCVSVEESFAAVDVRLDAEGLRLAGPLAQANGDRWTGPLSVYVQGKGGDGRWSWDAMAWHEVRVRQLLDGASILVTVGDFSDAEVAQMQAQVPVPVSRAA